MRNLLLTLFGLVFMVAGSQAQIITLWDDQDPSGGNITQIADPFGTGHGNIGEFTSNGQSQWSHYTLSGQDWSAYAGKTWTVSVDIYVTMDQTTNAAITDDSIYFAVGADQGGYTGTGSLVPDQWNTITWSGTFDSDPTNLTSSLVRLLDNHNNTHPATGANYYTDNYKLTVDLNTYFTINDLYIRPNTNKLVWGGTYDGFITNQPGTAVQGDQYADPVMIPLRWSELDVDGDGAADDYIDFTLVADAGAGNAGWSATGFGEGYSISTNGQSVAFSVVGVQASLGTSGSVQFDAFTGAQAGVGDWTGAGNWDVNIDINGNTVSAIRTNGVTGFVAFGVVDGALTNDTLTFDNPQWGDTGDFDASDDLTDDGILARSFDLKFSWSTNEVAVYIDATNAIEFVSGEGYSDAALDGQKNWASSDWTVDTANGGSVSCQTANRNMTYANGYALNEGQTLDFIVYYTLQGTHTPTVWTQLLRAGVTLDGSGSNKGYNGAAADPADQFAMAMVQSHLSIPNTFRVFNDAWNGPGSWPYHTAGAGDEMALRYSITLGEDAATTMHGMELMNISSNYSSGLIVDDNGISTNLYDALAGGNAFVYFEKGANGDGWTGAEVSRVEIIYPKLYVDGQTAYEAWASDYDIGGLGEDDDNDGLINLGEYAFGGNPELGSSVGVLPELDTASGDYNFQVIGDDSLTVTVYTNVNLSIPGMWGVHEVIPVSSTSGVLENYSSSINTSGNQIFIKLEVND